jgi:protein SCO1/2
MNFFSKQFLAFLLMALAFTSACSTPAATPEAAQPVGQTIDPPKPMPDFALVNQDGQPTSLSELRGKPLLFTFAYTHCPDICPMTVADFMRVKRALGDAGEQVNFAFISVDGERDTPEVLKHYLGTFDKTFVGLTGAPGVVAQIAKDYGAKFEAQKPQGTQASYLVSHTSFYYLLDSQGRWRKSYAFQTRPEPIANDLRQILTEAQSPNTNQNSESLSGFYADSKPKPIYMDTPVTMPDFTLSDQDGKPFRFNSLRGQWALLYFGSSNCQHPTCPPNVLAQYVQVKKLMGPQASKVAFIFASVDPNYDTPAILKTFVAKYDPAFIALTGGKDYISPIAVKYGVHIADQENTQPKRYLAHSVYSILIDPQGRWLIAFPFKMSAEDVAVEMKKLLVE